MNFKKSLYALAIAGACSASLSAQIIPINLGSYTSGSYDLSQVNANIPLGSGNYFTFNNFLYAGSGINFQVLNSSSSPQFIGFDIDGNGAFAVISSTGTANPVNFSAGQLIDGGSIYNAFDQRTLFQVNSTQSPDFGAGSYMGFRFSSGGGFKYGWLEVTWNSTSGNFQILNGAYEDTVGQSILAGSGASPVPEASGSVAGLGLAVAGLHQLRRRRQNTVTE